MIFPPPPPASGSAHPLLDAPLRKTAAAGGSARPFASTRAATGAGPSRPAPAASSRPRPRAAPPGARAPMIPRRPLGSARVRVPPHPPAGRTALRAAFSYGTRPFLVRPGRWPGGRPRQRSPLDARPPSTPVTCRPARHAKPLLDADHRKRLPARADPAATHATSASPDPLRRGARSPLPDPSRSHGEAARRAPNSQEN